MKVPPKWTAGWEPNADDFNTYISDVVEFLLEPPHARVRRDTTQSLTDGAFTTISFTVCDKDNDSMWSAGSPTLLTVQTPGWYEITYGGSCVTPGANYRLICGLIYNGSLDHANGGTRGRSDVVAVSGSNATTGGRMYSMFLNTGDTIGLVLYQQSGSAKNTTVSGEYDQPFLALKWVSF